MRVHGLMDNDVGPDHRGVNTYVHAVYLVASRADVMHSHRARLLRIARAQLYNGPGVLHMRVVVISHLQRAAPVLQPSRLVELAVLA